MTQAQTDLLIEFLTVLMRFILRHGSPAEQAEILEHWQEFYDGLVVRPD
jgi:hypothetical protein